ncbi:helix-turn-helix domain-containing protein [Salinimonas lutimaris]|uniref:helix-turn-helix domain-containing protein n=1 Tax=Salinimonas lutimaris TaxID=914153 RepID=UPI0010C109F4|nr:helix-turn-helix domain-containing protein [Salinimonas lutimaris]
MDISQVARKTGVPASTLRYYEQKGLITSVGRQGLRRVFKPDVTDRLALIALGRAAGLSLNEIGAMLGHQTEPEIDRELLLNKADELDRNITTLKTMRDGLRHVAQCTAPSHLECPRFRRLMGLAAAGELGDGGAVTRRSPLPPT